MQSGHWFATVVDVIAETYKTDNVVYILFLILMWDKGHFTLDRLLGLEK